MVGDGDSVDVVKGSVLLVTEDWVTGSSYVAALEKVTIPVEWVKTHLELKLRLDRADLPKPTLVMVLPSRRALPPSELASVALRLGAATGAPANGSALADALSDYCCARALSRRQRQVLELYLLGRNDKEIADSFDCSATTVYEHWRRMARKANGVHKSDVVTDFHRFLAGRSRPDVIPSWPASPGPPSSLQEP